MIKELEQVVMLVAELPEEYQKEAAQRLAWLLKRAEDEMTMTKEEMEEMERLRREKSRALYPRVSEYLDKHR